MRSNAVRKSSSPRKALEVRVHVIADLFSVFGSHFWCAPVVSHKRAIEGFECITKFRSVEPFNGYFVLRYDANASELTVSIKVKERRKEDVLGTFIILISSTFTRLLRFS